MAAYENPDFTALPTPLAALFAQAAKRSFFASPLWYHVLARYGTAPGTTPRVYADTNHNAALVCDVAKPGARDLDSLSNYYSTEHGPLYAVDGDARDSAFAAIAHELADARYDTVKLAGLDARDPAVAALESAFRSSGFVAHRYFDSGLWYEDTSGLDFAQYLVARPTQLRNTWKRKNKALENTKRGAFAFYDDATNIEAGVAAYEHVYAASWKGEEPFPDFMPQFIRAAATSGALRLGIASIDGEPAAAQCWILWDGRATIYKLAHQTKFDDLSLGTILSMRMMDRVLEHDKPREVDFGRGDDPYKKSWLSQRRERIGLYLLNRRTLRGRGLALREAAASTVKRLIRR